MKSAKKYNLWISHDNVDSENVSVRIYIDSLSGVIKKNTLNTAIGLLSLFTVSYFLPWTKQKLETKVILLTKKTIFDVIKQNRRYRIPQLLLESIRVLFTYLLIQSYNVNNSSLWTLTFNCSHILYFWNEPKLTNYL